MRAGQALYARALREGSVSGRGRGRAPCLVDFGLLHPAVDGPRLGWSPVAPAVALHRMLRTAADRIADERRREERLAELFEPLMRIDGHAHREPRRVADGQRPQRARPHRPGHPQAMAASSGELLTIQPHITHSRYTGRPQIHAEALARDQALLDRGGRSARSTSTPSATPPSVLARYEQLRGDVEARTLDEVTERLIVVDRTVAFIPASKDRTLALEVRHPALVDFFATTFDRLWRLATPMYPQAVRTPTLNGITPRQRAIAALLVEGHTDAVIADRLGMNIRTARVHIAKLAATLGSESRAQLGYLIGRSGILDREE